MRLVLALLSLLTLSGCASLEDEAERGYATKFWDTPSVFTTADVRIVTKRRHPLLGNEIVCTEPSPDVAKAIASSLGGSASGGNGAATGSLTINVGSTEAAAELAGRSTALLGLRDGLYRACEAYANGVIGQDVYALIVSHYGQLMTTLFLGQDLEGTAKATAGTTISSPGLPMPSSSTPSAEKQSGAKPAANAAVDAGLASARLIPAVYVTHLSPLDQADAIAATDPKALKDKTSTGSTTAGGETKPATTDAGVSARAIARMNEDYLHLGPISTLITSCINNSDRTRLRVQLLGKPGSLPVPEGEDGDLGDNSWLKRVCRQLDLTHLESLMKEGVDLTPAPVNPDLTTSQPTKSGGSPVTHGAAKADAMLKALQQALKAQGCAGCDPGTADGRDGAQTRSAVRAYQKAHGLPVTGNPGDLAFLTHVIHGAAVQL